MGGNPYKPGPMCSWCCKHDKLFSAKPWLHIRLFLLWLLITGGFQQVYQEWRRCHHLCRSSLLSFRVKNVLMSFRCKICPEDLNRFELKTNGKNYPKLGHFIDARLRCSHCWAEGAREPDLRKKWGCWDVEMFCCLNWTPKADFVYGQNPHFIHHTLEKLGDCAFHVKMPMWWSSKVYEKWKIRWKSWPCVCVCFAPPRFFKQMLKRHPVFSQGGWGWKVETLAAFK